MNWLAHLYLSKPTPEYRFGNLLPDLARPSEYRHLCPEIIDGVNCHNFIDSFTDSHPVFRRSVNRLSTDYRRFGGIIMDVFYDHLLTSEWPERHSQPLSEFTAAVHEEFSRFYSVLPAEIVERFEQVRAARILDSYGTLDGVELALHRVSRRLRGNFDLAGSVGEIRRHYEPLNDDYKKFFPELGERVVQFRELQSSNQPVKT